MLAAIAAALVRRALLRASFGAAVPVGHGAVPLAAAVIGLAAAFALLLAPLAEPTHLGLALAGGLALYWIALRLLLRATGADLKLTGFVTATPS